jgi:hypothetical protein
MLHTVAREAVLSGHVVTVLVLAVVCGSGQLQDSAIRTVCSMLQQSSKLWHQGEDSAACQGLCEMLCMLRG